MYDFTEKKFLSLPLERQHKKCAELLWHLYHNLLHQNDVEAEWKEYQLLRSWIKQTALKEINAKLLADCYHQHLRQAHLFKKEHHLLPQIRKGDQPIAADPWPIKIYLDHVRSAHNVGSILRTVEALALGNVYFSLDTPFIDHKQVKDTSMGTYEWISCKQMESISDLKHPIIALETSDDAVSLYNFIFPESFTLVVGNEEYGCSDNILQAADYLVEIPLRGRKNSLNVANAFAIAAGEIQRQRILKDTYDKKTVK